MTMREGVEEDFGLISDYLKLSAYQSLYMKVFFPFQPLEDTAIAAGDRTHNHARSSRAPWQLSHRNTLLYNTTVNTVQPGSYAFQKNNKNAGKNRLCERMYNPTLPKHCAVLLVNDNANVVTAISYKMNVSTRFYCRK